MSKISDFTEIQERLVELYEKDGLTPEVLFLSQLMDNLIVDEQRRLMEEKLRL